MPSISTVVITHAEPLDFTRDYVALPGEYGSPTWERREDILAINRAVWQNLTDLDARVHFTKRLEGRRVILKPNLVCVFHELGMREADYPETTDPRVIDAVVVFLKRFTDKLVIAEGSGRGFPTRGAFHLSGLDRLARCRGVELIALEEEPVDRYLLPRAKVMREIVIPQIFRGVVTGEDFYISLPKMKTNLYTGVTLGFKNAMGVLPYNLRQRNHTRHIDQKLVDILHLFKPDLTIIDGLVAGEGNCPAPVEPVSCGVIISGNQAVETDRVATRMMGIDPAQIELMRVADDNGFNDPAVEILGEQRVHPFKQADPSLTGEWMRTTFPKVRVLVGFPVDQSHSESTDANLDRESIAAMEAACRGGCLATTRYAFDMFFYEGQPQDFPLTLVLGPGVLVNDHLTYFDREGRHWNLDQIGALHEKVLAVGSCASPLRGIATRFVSGCMPFPNSPHQALHLLTGTLCRVMSLHNRHLFPLLAASLRTSARRKNNLRRGLHMDVPLFLNDTLTPPREFIPDELEQPYLIEPFPPLTPADIKRLCAEENRAALATFLP